MYNKKPINKGDLWQSKSNQIKRSIFVGILFIAQTFNGCKITERAGHMNGEDSKQEMANIRITTVRYNEKQGREVLVNYIFGGFRAGPRVPRGIDPELVSQVIEEELKPDSPPDAYANTVKILRFYERSDCLPYIRRVLTGQEQKPADINRSAYAVQAVAEMGRREDVQDVAQYFDSKLAGHPKAIDAIDVLLETLVVLGPAASEARLSKRIADEVNLRKKAENESEEGMRAYQQVAAIQRLKLPQALIVVNAKKKILAMNPDERRAELVNIYLGNSPVSDDLMIIWAGRMLRQEAMESDPKPIYAAFASEIAKTDPKKVGEDAMTDTIVSRSAQAIIYLQGRLTKTERELYEKTKLAAMNFLWDDLNM